MSTIIREIIRENKGSNRIFSNVRILPWNVEEKSFVGVNGNHFMQENTLFPVLYSKIEPPPPNPTHFTFTIKIIACPEDHFILIPPARFKKFVLTTHYLPYQTSSPIMTDLPSTPTPIINHGRVMNLIHKSFHH